MSGLGEKLFCVTEEDIKCVRQYYEKSEEDIKKDCDVIRQWMKQQSHLPDDYDLARVDRFLLRNKFQLERTKKKLEKYYTARGADIHFFRKMDPEDQSMQKTLRTISFTPLPKLLNNIERIYVQRFIGNDSDYSWEYNSLIVLALLEMELRHEYAVGIRFICDFEGFRLEHLKNMEVNLLSKTFSLFQECLSARIISVEYINTPSILNLLLDILKLALPTKLYNKIRIHKNLESLRRVIPVEYLPSDYGGILRSTDEIHEDVKKFLMENKKYIMKRLEVVSDESKRVGEVERNDMFGADGTFKRINLD